MGKIHDLTTLANAILKQWSVTDDSAANTAKTITKAAVAGARHYITMVEVVISAAAAGGDINCILQDGTTAKWKEVIGSAAVRGTKVGFSIPNGIEMSTNAAANLVVDAGGAACVTSLNMAGYTLTL